MPKYFNYLKISILCFGLLLLINQNPLAQDANFSLFHRNPTQTNPALIATSNQINVRFHYRSQFISAGNAYTTPMVDITLPWKKKKTIRKGAFGIAAISDRAGENGILQTDGLNLTAAYNIPLNPIAENPKKYFISAGLQGGIYQRKINTNAFTSGNQFDLINAIFDPNIPVGEQLALINERKSFFLLNFGASFYATDTCDNVKAYLGFNLRNLNQPDVSFFGDGSKLPYSLIIAGGIDIFRTDRFTIHPNFRWIQENNIESELFTSPRQIRFGSLFYYNFINTGGFIKDGKIGLGLWYDQTNTASIGVDIEQPNYTLAFAYDMGNLGQKNTLGGGALEFSLGLKFGKKCLPKQLPKEEIIKDTSRVEVKEEDGSVTIYTIVADIEGKEVIKTDTIDIERIEKEIEASDALPTEEDLKIFKRKAFFYYVSDDINKATASLLEDMVATMKKFRGIRIMLEGHTCTIGDNNQGLSEERARSVKKFLTDRGIAEDRIETRGFGSTRPVLSNKTEYGRIKNRRVEFEVLDTGENKE